MGEVQAWTLDGADGETIYGATHLPPGEPVGTLVLCHGLKGYKDYGFFPQLAEAAAKRGLIVHRFSFSHSGMTDRLETFERPDLFERDTWGKQIADLKRIARAIADGELPGSGAPVVWFGHSRGGVTVLLTARELLSDETAETHRPAALIAAATPHWACNLDDEQKQTLHAQGRLEMPSGRTGQMLYVGREWLAEQERDPDRFDVVRAAATVDRPLLVLHGSEDPTVPPDAAHRIADAAGQRATLKLIENAQHTFNAPNPLPLEDAPPAETTQMIDMACDFASRQARAHASR